MTKKFIGFGFAAGFVLFFLLIAVTSAFPGGQSAGGEEILISTHGRYPQRVLLKLPNGFDSKKKYPLIVGLHGHGGDAAGFATAFSGFRDQPVLIAVPQGEYQTAGGGWSWYLKTEDRSLWEAADSVTVARVVDAISEIAATYPVEKIFVFGFSQGASLAYMVGLRNPSLIAGVAAVSGYLPEIDEQGALLHVAEIAKAKKVRIFVGRGVSDNLVSREEYTRQVEYLSKAGFVVTTYEFQGGHTLTGMLMARMWKWLKEGLI